jgi:RNA polymerase sigma factor, sigma-70 family
MSFADIVRMYQQPIYWYIRRVVIVHEDAEDIMQETFLKAYKHLWQLRSPESMKPWMYRIATNELNRHFRKRTAITTLEGLPEQALSDLSESQDLNALGTSSKVISAAMLKMSPLQRQVFSMRYYDDLDYDQISKITGATKNTLMVSYHEARKRIEKEIENE